MSGKQAIVPADMQRRAKKIATQASQLADEARPMTEKAKKNAQRGAETAKRGAASANEWAKPRVNGARAWMAVRAARGSVAVQETVAPKVSDLMATAAKKLDPPKRRARRLPKILAGLALLAAGAAAAAAVAMRNKRTMTSTMPPPPPMPPSSDATEGNVAGTGQTDPSASDVDGYSRTS